MELTIDTKVFALNLNASHYYWSNLHDQCQDYVRYVCVYCYVMGYAEVASHNEASVVATA